MNGSPVAGWVRAWVRLYTRGLPDALRADRRDEIDDDLWCQLEDAAAEGRSRRAVDSELLVRLVLGMPADVGWSLAQRGRPAPASVERSPSMTDRTLGMLAVVAALMYLVLMALYIPVGYALWTGGIGVYVVLATFLGVLAFAATGIGFAWHHQEHLSPIGAFGGALVAIGAFITMGGTMVILAVGSAILVWDLGRLGVVTRREWAVHVIAALIVVVGFVLFPAESGQPERRALAMALFAPFLLSWLAIGVSLIRRARPVEAASAA
jgi:hypothetical protein